MLTLDPDLGLVVLEVRRPTGTGWALPGTFLHEGETLADAVDRSLRIKANVRGLHPRQLHVFDDPDRDDRGWVLSVAHVEVVRPNDWHRGSPTRPDSCRSTLQGVCPTTTSTSSTLAVDHVRSHYADKPDPDGCSATSSRFETCGSRTRRSPGGSCSATPSGVRWSRNSSPLGKRRSAPEGVPQRCSGGTGAQSRLGDGSCETLNRIHRRVPRLHLRAGSCPGVVLTGRLSGAWYPVATRICSGSLVRTSGLMSRESLKEILGVTEQFGRQRRIPNR